MKEIIMNVSPKKIERVIVNGVLVKTYRLGELEDIELSKPKKHRPNQMGYEGRMGEQMQYRTDIDGELKQGSLLNEDQRLTERVNMEDGVI